MVLEFLKDFIKVALVLSICVLILDHVYPDVPDTEVCVGDSTENISVTHGSKVVYISCPIIESGGIDSMYTDTLDSKHSVHPIEDRKERVRLIYD